MSTDRRQRSEDISLGFGAAEDPVFVTVILPAYNESDSIEGVYHQVVGVLEPQGYSFEILFIDDGSTDDTWSLIRSLTERDDRVRALRHRRNCGKASALANGFSYARGEIMVTSDADMQYDPEDIVRLINKVREGYDVVSAHKVVRRDPLNKRLPSKFFNFFVRNTTGVQLHDFNAGLKAYRYDAAGDLISFGYGELHRFFALLAARMGYSVAEVPVESRYRTTGHSKYGAERYMRGALDFLTVYFLTGYTERPLHFLGAGGISLAGIGTAIFAYLSFVGIVQGQSIAGRPLLDVAVLFVLSGMQLLVVGLLAEMINNLKRGSGSRAKVAQVLGVERRSSGLLSSPVQVERRQRTSPHAEPLHPQPPAPVPASVGLGRRASDRVAVSKSTLRAAIDAETIETV